MMNDKDNIKIIDIYSYNYDLGKKYKNKIVTLKIKKIVFSITLGIIYCILFLIANKTINLNISIDDYVSLIIGISSLILFFSNLFYFFMLLHDLGYKFFLDSETCYVRTEDNRFFILKFDRDIEYYKYELIIESLSKLIKSVIKNSESNGNSDTNNVEISQFNEEDLLFCYEVININDLKYKENYAIINCDYIEYTDNQKCVNKEIKIYNYFNKYSDLMNYIQELSHREKKYIEEYNTYKKYVEAILIGSKNKNNLIFYIFGIFLCITNPLSYSTLFLGFIAIILYCQNKAIKYCDIAEDREIISKDAKINKIFLSIFLIIYIFSLFIFPIDSFIGTSALIYSFVFAIIFIFKKVWKF